VGRQLPDVVSAIVGRDRLDPVGTMFGEILEREVSAVLFAERHNLCGNLTAIEGVASLLGNQLITAGQVRVLEDLSLFGRATAGKIRLRRIWPFAQRLGRALPAVGDDIADRKALAGVIDGRFEELGKA